MNTKKTLVALGALAATTAPALALFGAFPVLSNFDSDLLGAAPGIGLPNQPQALIVPAGGSILVQARAFGLDHQPVVLSDDDGEYTAVSYGLSPSTGSVRFEATASFGEAANGFFMQTATPAGAVLARLQMSASGNILAGAFVAGTYTPGVPQRIRIDTDMVSGTWSVSIDDELDGFANDPTIQGLPHMNPGQTEVGRAIASLSVFGAMAASIAYDDIYVGSSEIGTQFCFGDGSGVPCPCGNNAAPGEGCANSTGQGATATADGSTSATLDDLVVFGGQLPRNQPALLFSTAEGDEPGVPFGDGLRCTFNSVVRLQVRAASPSGDLQFGPGLRDVGGWSQGETRRMQIWYRDPVGPCGSGFNTTNAIEVSFSL